MLIGNSDPALWYAFFLVAWEYIVASAFELDSSDASPELAGVASSIGKARE